MPRKSEFESLHRNQEYSNIYISKDERVNLW